MMTQKILCMAALISGVLVFLYALGIMTDLYDTLYSTMMNPADLSDTDVPGSVVYYNMQEFNSIFLNYSIMMILLACLLFITNTHIRRRYYIGNFVATGIYVAFSLYLVAWSHMYIEVFKQQFLAIDFEALKLHSETWNSAYTESTFWFDIHYAIFAIVAVVSIALVANAVWKVKIMKEEGQLLGKGKGAVA